MTADTTTHLETAAAREAPQETLSRHRPTALGAWSGALFCGLCVMVLLSLLTFLPLRTAIRIGRNEDYEG